MFGKWREYFLYKSLYKKNKGIEGIDDRDNIIHWRFKVSEGGFSFTAISKGPPACVQKGYMTNAYG